MKFGSNGIQPKNNGKKEEFKLQFAEEYDNAKNAQINYEQGINACFNRSVVEACNRHMTEYGVEDFLLFAIR